MSPTNGFAGRTRMTVSISDGGTRPAATRRDVLALALGLTGSVVLPAHAAASGTLTYGVHISLAPTWFDPGETAGLITPFMLLYALHDGLVKSMPGQLQAPSLAESYTLSEDGLVYDF